MQCQSKNLKNISFTIKIENQTFQSTYMVYVHKKKSLPLSKSIQSRQWKKQHKHRQRCKCLKLHGSISKRQPKTINQNYETTSTPSDTFSCQFGQCERRASKGLSGTKGRLGQRVGYLAAQTGLLCGCWCWESTRLPLLSVSGTAAPCASHPLHSR